MKLRRNSQSFGFKTGVKLGRNLGEIEGEFWLLNRAKNLSIMMYRQ